MVSVSSLGMSEIAASKSGSMEIISGVVSGEAGGGVEHSVEVVEVEEGVSHSQSAAKS